MGKTITPATPSVAQVNDERGKHLLKGRNAAHDARVNADGQLVKVAVLLLDELVYSQNMAVRTVMAARIKNWNEDYLVDLLRLPYADRVRIASALCIGELDRLTFNRSNQQRDECVRPA